MTIRKFIKENTNFKGYEKYIDELSIRDSIKNIFCSEKRQTAFTPSQTSFIDWFCGLPTCIEIDCSEVSCEKYLKELGYNNKEIEIIPGQYMLEKLGYLYYIELFYNC